MVQSDGLVRVCCHNPIIMGDLKSQLLEDIWTGNKFEVLRNKVAANDFSYGCSKCPIVKKMGHNNE